MQNTSRSEVTRILVGLSHGNRASANKLMPLVYDEFRSIASNFLRQERPGHTLQPTELVHEAYLRLVDLTRIDWRGRSHFFAIGAQAMRRILVDYAKSKKRQKRGGDQERIALDENLALSPRRDEDILELDEALNKLAMLNTRQARMVELRFFGGLTAEEIGEGGIGKVFLARHAMLKRPTAVKILRSDVVSEETLIRFENTDRFIVETFINTDGREQKVESYRFTRS